MQAKPTLKFPTPLPAQGRIRIVSVAGRVRQEPFFAGLERLAQRGFELDWQKAALSTEHPYLASSTEQRAADFLGAFAAESNADAVMCARGGFGSMHLLGSHGVEELDLRHIPFLGFSDITALHLSLNRRGWVTYHGPVITAMAGATEEALDSALGWLTGAPVSRTLKGTGGWGDPVEGRLVGGNLSLLESCLGAPGCDLLPDSILLIEEINEPLYRIDRMLSALDLRGALQHVVGVALGSFHGCASEQPGDGSQLASTVVRGFFESRGMPVVEGFPVGHRSEDLTVPLGAPTRLDPTKLELCFLPGDDFE
ncbi:MAG: LD-carboxypeptidase [Myxococcales bacterium]|nr:LD-carboxypeptidase [Myxococcales bacterium]